MKTATVNEMKKNPGGIIKTARNEAVTILDRGKPVFVIYKASAVSALERAKKAVSNADNDLDDFGVFDWQ